MRHSDHSGKTILTPCSLWGHARRFGTCYGGLILLGVLSYPALADESAFTTGPVFDAFGPAADVDVTMVIPKDSIFLHSFDVSSPGSKDSPNRTLVSVARFINMHARAGVAPEQMHLAVVVHGQAVKDVSDKQSSSAELIAALVEQGVRIIVCGQSAAYYDVATKDLLPGVEMALSAMTAHALLQQQGYSLNPF